MGSDDALPELVRDTELPTTFHHNNALTIHYKRWDRRKRELWHRNQSSIGRGGYGHVWLEQEIDSQGNRKDSKVRAVKEIACPKSRQNMKDYVRELEAIAKFSQDKYSDYFVRSHGWYQSPDSLYIAMEYCPCGDLKNHVALNGAVGEKDAQVIISQILRGLAHMHEEKFAHRDLKPANVLIVSRPPNEWVVKLSDFGLTKRAIQSESTTVKGTFAYLPPELLDENARKTDHFAGDMWCVGETAYELITAITVFPFLSTRVKYTHDQSVFPSEELRKAGAGNDALNFVMATMAPSPHDRPTAINALKHAWIPEYDDPEDSPQLPNIMVDWPQICPSHDAIAGTAQWTTAIIPPIAQSTAQEATLIIPTSPTETPVRVESGQNKSGKTSSDDTVGNAATQRWTGSPDDPMNETIALVADLAVRDAADIVAASTGKPGVAATDSNPRESAKSNAVSNLGHCAVAAFSYEKSEDNEIDLFEGKYVRNIEFVDEDWWWGRNHEGETGLFPSNYVKLLLAGPPSGEGNTVVSLYDYEATEDNELSFPKKVRITNVEFLDDLWWYGTYKGQEGLFPANYVALSRSRHADEKTKASVQNGISGSPSSTSSGDTEVEIPDGIHAISFRRWFDPTSFRMRPKFQPFTRYVDGKGGKLHLERFRTDLEDSARTKDIVGFKSKVISRRHAVIELQPDGTWWLQDVGSRGGTFLNNVRLSESCVTSKLHALRDGDLVQLGVDFTEETDDEKFGAVQMTVHFTDPAENWRLGPGRPPDSPSSIKAQRGWIEEPDA